MLEVGVCMEGSEGGHSILMWNDYFTKASIYTFDIVDMSLKSCITKNDNVFFYQGDQSNREHIKNTKGYNPNVDYDKNISDDAFDTILNAIGIESIPDFKYSNKDNIYIDNIYM
jgi:hypothetical protein